MDANLPSAIPPPGQMKPIELGPEFFVPSTGGRPPRIQLATKARRKSDPELEPPPDSKTTFDPSSSNSHQFAQRLFEDHNGNQCVSIWDDRLKIEKTGKSFLPPWSYQVYITFGCTASSPQTIQWCNELYNDVWRSAVDFLSAGFRLDFIFLPNATPWKCVQHYRLEKPLRAESDIPLVPTYATEGMGSRDAQQNALLIVDDKDIAGKGLKFVRFDASAEDILKPESEAVPWIDRLSNRFYLYHQLRPDALGTIFEPLEELYKLSQIRSTLEKGYRIARQEAVERSLLVSARSDNGAIEQ